MNIFYLFFLPPFAGASRIQFNNRDFDTKENKHWAGVGSVREGLFFKFMITRLPADVTSPPNKPVYSHHVMTFN